ncbi:MAG TPA: hypothetical protein VFH20_07405, partial [Propionibacteriaceae bacterium]|nr:hypothetical protein [Propionibacteriaceae bacterium]
IFPWSVLPMLAKAHRTRDLASYSLGNLLPANVGNAVHSIYVFSLPAGEKSRDVVYDLVAAERVVRT